MVNCCQMGIRISNKDSDKRNRRRKLHDQEDKEKERPMKMDFLETCKSGTESTSLQLQGRRQGLTKYLWWLWWAATDEMVVLAVAVATAQAAMDVARLTVSPNHAREQYAAVAIQIALKGS